MRFVYFLNTFFTGTDAVMVGVTNTSTLIIHNVRNDFSLAEMQPLQQQMPCEIRCVAASPSAHMVAVGDDAGGIHLWCNSDATASGNVLKIIFQNFQKFFSNSNTNLFNFF